jgi:hypothetical protein
MNTINRTKHQNNRTWEQPKGGKTAPLKEPKHQQNKAKPEKTTTQQGSSDTHQLCTTYCL